MAKCIALRSGILTFAFLAFELYWVLVLPSYTRGPNSTWSDVYAHGGNVSALVGRSVSVLLFMKPEKDLVKLRVSDSGPPAGESLPLWKRWLRGLEIVLALRGVGWEY